MFGQKQTIQYHPPQVTSYEYVMNTDDLMCDLAIGELANTVYAELPTVGFDIKANFKPPIMKLINQGLIELYKRFEILTDYVDIQPDGRKLYKLELANAVSSLNPTPFIMDSDLEPWRDNIGKIVAITDPQGQRLALGTRPLGHPNNCRCASCIKPVILQPAEDTLIIPIEYLDLITIEYKATHPVIPYSPTYTNLVLDLPEEYRQALLLFVAMKLIVPKQDQLSRGDRYNNMYENECQRISMLGTEDKQNDSVSFLRQHDFP